MPNILLPLCRRSSNCDFKCILPLLQNNQVMSRYSCLNEWTSIRAARVYATILYELD